MRTAIVLVLAGCTAIAAGTAYVQATPRATPPQPASVPALAATHQAVIDRYCLSCHNSRLRTAGIALDTVDLNQAAANGQLWEKVVAKLRTRSMPPVGMPRPDEASYDALAAWLEDQLDRAAAARPNPGDYPPAHRLNRAEYQNAIRDLLALEDLPRELDIAVLLPADDASYGFDNIAEALGTSPTLIERYLDAARKISRLAIGSSSMPMIVDTYRVPPQLPQEDRLDGLPFGTRGGIAIRRHFPLDGEYAIRVVLGSGRAADPHELEVGVDGARVQVFTVEDRGRARESPYADPVASSFEVRQAIKAGPRLVTVTFVKKTSAYGEEILRPFSRSGRVAGVPQPAVASVTITGPLGTAAPGDTPSRQRIFVCRPSSEEAEAPCASRILSTLARRAFRRPVSDADLQVLLPFFEAGRSEGGFERGIEQALERLLVSPSFLFRVEREPAVPAPGVWPISDVELASRLSFFLWSSIPDDELLDHAVRGTLRQPGVLERQVQRMLADSRSHALVDNFAGQWLYLRNLEAVSPDPRLFPDFDEGLRRALRRETELFVEHIVRENRSVLDFLTADYTFLNERLASHYGIPHIYGDGFRLVRLTGTPRRGLLGHGSILTVTSYPHRTSPVLRGKWMLENLLGAPPPPPPPDVPALEEINRRTGKPLTMREAMVQHRANPACASCHSRMDPLGFALENFDAIGRWRTHSADQPIDASGTLPDGTTFDGAAGLRDALALEPRQFVTTITERLMTYGLGRGLEFYDAPAVRAVGRAAAADGYRFSSIITGIVRSVPFQMRASAARLSSRAATR